MLRALQILGVTRRRRFVSTMPVWLHLLPGGKELQIVEDGGRVTVRLPTKGSWPAAGATIDLFMPKRAAAHCPGETVELHATDGAVALWADRWHVRLNLLAFGAESRVPRPPKSTRRGAADLPLFRWAARRRSSDHREARRRTKTPTWWRTHKTGPVQPTGFRSWAESSHPLPVAGCQRGARRGHYPKSPPTAPSYRLFRRSVRLV